MIATNHALTGAVIGLSVANPWLAIPLAFASHFVLDSFPHFGFGNLHERGRRFTLLLLADTALCGLLVMGLFLSNTELWLVASFAAFAAASPDFMWAPDFFRHKTSGKPENHQSSAIKRFHARIQWYQRPPGAFIEIAYFVLILAVLANLI